MRTGWVRGRLRGAMPPPRPAPAHPASQSCAWALACRTRVRINARDDQGVGAHGGRLLDGLAGHLRQEGRQGGRASVRAAGGTSAACMHAAAVDGAASPGRASFSSATVRLPLLALWRAESTAPSCAHELRQGQQLLRRPQPLPLLWPAAACRVWLPPPPPFGTLHEALVPALTGCATPDSTLRLPPRQRRHVSMLPRLPHTPVWHWRSAPLPTSRAVVFTSV